MSKFIPDGDLTLSPITHSGNPIFSRAGSAVDVKTGEIIMGSYQVHTADILEVLRLLDVVAPILQCTTELGKLREAMVRELKEVLEAVA